MGFWPGEFINSGEFYAKKLGADEWNNLGYVGSFQYMYDNKTTLYEPSYQPNCTHNVDVKKAAQIVDYMNDPIGKSNYLEFAVMPEVVWSTEDVSPSFSMEKESWYIQLYVINEDKGEFYFYKKFYVAKYENSWVAGPIVDQGKHLKFTPKPKLKPWTIKEFEFDDEDDWDTILKTIEDNK